jgi:GST-like protein
MWTLFGSDGSGSAAVEMALMRCAVPFRLERAATWEPDSAQLLLRAANPLGQIPTLQMEDGSVMTESAAILIQLGLQFPRSSLLPTDARERAQVLRGLVFIAANCYAAIGIIDYPERWCAQAQAADLEQLRQGARIRLHQLWETFADQFPVTGPYWGGQAPSALDLLAAVVSRWSGARAHLAQQRPELSTVFQRIESDATLAPVFARHWPTRQVT